MERLAVLVNTTQFKLGTVLDKLALEALLHLPSRDLVAQLLHEHLHYVVSLGVDAESG